MMISYHSSWTMILCTIGSEVSFQSDMQICFRAVVKQKWKKIRPHTLVASLWEVLWVRTVLFVGKCEFRFRRFKKASRAFATRAKARLLDQNRQPPDCTAQRSNHWAKTTNLTYQDVNHCNYKVWLQKRIHNQKNMLNRSLFARQLWCWVPQWR